jgi:hypothetical protein
VNPVRIISAIIASIAYWSLVAFLMLGQLDCVGGSAEYPCPTAGARNRAWLLILVVGAAVYALGWRWIRNRHRAN